MSEADEDEEDDQTNIWLTPPSRTAGRPPGPRDPSEPKADETSASASARALAEGWPTSPGWVPDGAQSWSNGSATPSTGNAWPPGVDQTQHADQQYGNQQYGNQQPVWIPSQSPYPTHPDLVGAGAGTPPPAAYPGPPPPLPRSNTGTIVGVVVGVLVLVAGGVTAGVVLSGRGSDTPAPVATAPAGSTGSGTSSAGTSSAGTNSSSTNSSSTNSSSTRSGSTRENPGSTSSGTGSTGSSSSGGIDIAPGTGTLDLQTITLGGGVIGADAADIALTLDAYFTGINGRDYSSAWSQLSPSQQAKNPLSQFTQATSGTIDRDVRLTAATVGSDGTARASVTFSSTQPGSKGVNPGEVCTDWSISYLLVRGSGAGGWVISDTPSAQHSAC